jgi:hypothetical protein
MDSKRLTAVCAPALVVAAFTSFAQGTPTTVDAARPPAVVQPAAKSEPTAPDPARSDVAAKKPAAKMKKGAIRAPGEQEPLESPTKAPLRTPAKAPANSTNSGVTVQRFDPRTPILLHDANGNAIPTSPEAYDVSSATGKKK